MNISFDLETLGNTSKAPIFQKELIVECFKVLNYV